MRINGCQMVIEALQQENVDTIFGFPGGVPFSLHEQLLAAKIQYIISRHEQGAAHAADGYARATGKPGIVFAISGSIATDLITGLATAFMDSVPIVVFTGEDATSPKSNDIFREVDINAMTLPVTKHSYVVEDVRELPRTIKEAFYIATTGRCGPVLIDIPRDVQESTGIFKYPKKVIIPGYHPTYQGHPGQISWAAKLLAKSKRPIIYAGGGVIYSGAYDELRQLAERAEVPVATTLMGLPGFPGGHPLALGMLGMHGTYWANMAVHEADLIMAIGARFDDRVTCKTSTFASNAKIIHIDIDPAEIGKNVSVDIPIVGDVKTVLTRFLSELEPPETKEWLARIEEWRRFSPLRYQQDDGIISPQYVIEQIYEQTGGKALITTDVGQHQMWTALYYRFTLPRSLASSGGLGTMGYGFPASIGVQAGRPDDLVFCVAGDGSFQMNARELSTAVAYNLPIKVAILNNQCLGLVRQWQEMFFRGRFQSVDLNQLPDFVKLAQAYGATGLRAETSAQVVPALRKAMETPGPVVIDFRVKAGENVYPMVPPNCTISDMVGT
ncbi:MAG: biosynthetic-type acetolactate synthase large subunit [Dethiobacter sp.]|jgi:acetolactate synthase-1/2/3 large subunit|nr:biosynthetic-type acetolactate synthase large subunit [Dethiobacter sp.]